MDEHAELIVLKPLHAFGIADRWLRRRCLTTKETGKRKRKGYEPSGTHRRIVSGQPVKLSLCMLLLPLLVWAGTLRVEVRRSEVWLLGDGQEKQLTHDEKPKEQAILSPSGSRIVYLEQCFQGQDCTAPSVAVLDLEGRRIRSFQPNGESAPPEKPCSSITSITWASEDAIAAECHINPSLNEYIETSISTGQSTRDLLGYDFVLSPDGRLVAHVGWIVHFAPPYAQSNYLQIDHTKIYPLPKGMRPVEQIGLTEPPKVVRKVGPTYTGIHEFQPGLSWSPDAQHIALIDCTYNWTPNSPGSLSGGDGKESGRRCSLAVVSLSGKETLFPLTDVPTDDLREARVQWANPHQLSLHFRSFTRDFRIP